MAPSIHAVATAVLALLPLSLATVYNTRFAGTTWDDANWLLTTTVLDQGHYQSRMSLANGYLGINVASTGPFFEVDTPVAGDIINGWPLFDRRQTFATISGFLDFQPETNGSNFAWLYQYGGESVISGVPHWAGLHVQVGNDILDATVPASQISNYKSTLDIKHAMMSWSYTWTPGGGTPIAIEYSLLVHKLYINQAAVQLKMTAQKNVNVSVIDVLHGDCAVRTTPVGTHYESDIPVIWSAVSPDGVSDVKAYFYSATVGGDVVPDSRKKYTVPSVIGGNSSSIAQAFTVALTAGKPSTMAKYIGGASTDAFADPQSTALNATWCAANEGFAGMMASHSQEWASIMPADSVDSYRYANGSLPDDANVVELQITAVTGPFHLMQNTVGTNAIAQADNNDNLDVNSIAVGGLGSASYAGLIFWDAEVWMAPGLVVSHPQSAKQIARYRSKRLPQAQKNVKTAYQSSQNMTGKFSPSGAVFPWTSGRYGNCTGTGPCFDYEYHINGDIGLELFNFYVVTGDTNFFKQQLFPVYEGIAQFYSDVVTLNKTTGKYSLYNATDPDEYANFETNVGYTMVLMQTHIDKANTLRQRFGMPQNATWAKIASAIDIPIDQEAGLILEYGAMNGSVLVKQADVVLVDDFLDYPNPYSLADLEYYASKQSPNGPGMTYAVFSINANALSTSGCASYTYDLYGSQPYTRGPWFQFSEQLVDDYTANGGTHPAYPFLTGIGGANRVAVFSFLGLRLVLDSLNVNPSLPPQIPQLEYRTIYWQGWPIKAVANQTHTTLTRVGAPMPNANSTFAKAAIPVTIGIQAASATSGSKVYSLTPGGSLTLMNRQIGNVKTVPGNMAQCQSASSTQVVVPGQFPLSAVDGSSSTKWQPAQANISSYMTVVLPEPFVPISQIKFDWAQSPPTMYSVIFHNASSMTAPGAVHVTSSSDVKISNPYVAADAAKIVPYSSNTTNVTLSKPVWSAKYATLEIAGNQANKGTPDEKNGTGASVAEFAIVAAS